MKLMVLILNRTERLDALLEGFSTAGISGATIIESSGLAQTLNRMGSSLLTTAIKDILGAAAEDDNRTVLSVIKDEQLDTVRKVVYATVGDLSLPNTGVLFTVPIDFAEGIPKI